MFRLNNSLVISGTSLQTYPSDTITLDVVIQLFGAPTSNYIDQDAGYEGNDWFFEETSTGEVANLYIRWGQFRIGARSRTVALRFQEWLEKYTSNSERYKRLAALIT